MRETDDMITVASRGDEEPLIVGSAMSDRRGHSLRVSCVSSGWAHSAQPAIPHIVNRSHPLVQPPEVGCHSGDLVVFDDHAARRLAQCTRHLTITMQRVHGFRHRGGVSWRHGDAALPLTENVRNPTDGARDGHRARRHAFR